MTFTPTIEVTDAADTYSSTLGDGGSAIIYGYPDDIKRITHFALKPTMGLNTGTYPYI